MNHVSRWPILLFLGVGFAAGLALRRGLRFPGPRGQAGGG
jgi:hypothetical protein